MNYTNFVKITSGETSYTFGYLWYKENNDRHLYLGKSGKGSCIHIVYNKLDKTAFKSNVGYFKECDIYKSLKRGAGGTYLMLFSAMYLLIKKYPECKLIDWTDNSMITLRINNREYDVSLNDSDTIITGYPRIQNIISKEAIVFESYKKVIGNINKLVDIRKIPFNDFYSQFYKTDLFTDEEKEQLKNIYQKNDSLVEFFKSADEYLKTVGKKKYIFIPLKDIIDHYDIFGFVGQNWIVDIHKAFNHIKSKYDIKFSRTQTGGGNKTNTNDIKTPHISRCDDFYNVNHKWYDLRVYRNIIKTL
jgi:hypothetical protein